MTITPPEIQKKLWLSNLRYTTCPTQFPREIQLVRMKVNNEKHFVSSIEKLNAIECFYSVFTNWQRLEWYYDTIFLETDYSSKEIANKKHIKIMNFFKENGYHARVLFSGCRSYHYYLDFPLTKFIDYKSKVKQWAKRIPAEFDSTTIGDSAQLARIAGTIHEKTGLYCVPVGSKINPASCVDLNNIKRTSEIVLNKNLPKDLEGINVKDAYTKMTINITGTINSSIPPCILVNMKYLRNTGECGHMMRLHMGTYLTKTLGVRTAINFFKSFANDYKPSLTAYHIKYFVDHDWNCYSCNRVIGDGECPMPEGKVCNYYPSINHHI